MAHAIEEPKYTVLANLDNVEIRRYAPSIQATTEMPAERGNNSGFRRLAGYIFGGNSDGAKIAMTAPVSTSTSGGATEMSFTMPSEWSLESLPEPEDENVQLKQVPAYTVAVVTFSGRATEKRALEMEQELRARLSEESIEPSGPAILNQYNPPWTLPFLRRNEIMLSVDWRQ